MRKTLAFLLMFFGVILLCGDTPDMDLFIISKIIGVLLMGIGCFLIPDELFK